MNSRIDEKNSVTVATEVRNFKKYFPVVRILTAGSRSLIGVEGQILKVRNCRKIGKANSTLLLFAGVWALDKKVQEFKKSPFKQHHNCIAKHNFLLCGSMGAQKDQTWLKLFGQILPPS